jgi:acyl-CoA synthetase (AMP-forming)/AMP-acid ligase II
LRAGETLSIDELVEFLKPRLARYMIPKYVEFVKSEDLPRTLTGKVEKYKVKEKGLTGSEFIIDKRKF